MSRVRSGEPLFERITAGRVRYDPNDREDRGNLQRGRIALPVAVLPPSLVEALGAETSVVRLSVADGLKQSGRGRGVRGEAGLPASDYAILQRLVDGRFWTAVLRRAATVLTEIYLKSLHRGRDEQETSNRARGLVVRPAVPLGDDGDDGRGGGTPPRDMPGAPGSTDGEGRGSRWPPQASRGKRLEAGPTSRSTIFPGSL